MKDEDEFPWSELMPQHGEREPGCLQMTIRFIFPPLKGTGESKYLMKENIGHYKTKTGS